MTLDKLFRILTALMAAYLLYDVVALRPASSRVLKAAAEQNEQVLHILLTTQQDIKDLKNRYLTMRREIRTVRDENEQLVAANNLSEARYRKLLLERRRKLTVYLDSARHELETLQRLQAKIKAQE